MPSDKQPSAVPIRAQLSGVEIVGDLEKKNSNAREDHFVMVYVDEKEVAKSDKKPGVPAPRWEWPEDCRFLFHPSSTIKIVIYRTSRTHINQLKHLVGQHISQAIELLENDATVDLKDKTGVAIPSQIKIKLSLVSDLGDNFKTFMDNVDSDIARIDGTVASASVSALGTALQFTKNIMDIIADAHPVLKASWTILSSVYEAAQQTVIFDDNIRDLADRLREMLGLAKECPYLLVIEGTSNVIDEIGRTSLKIASLIHEYTQSPFIGRTVNSKLSDDMKARIAQYQKSCDDLKQKFGARLAVHTNHQATRIEGDTKDIKDDVKGIKGDMDKNNATLKTMKDDQLAEKIFRWLSAPDSSKNYNEAREKHKKDTCSWFLNGTRFRDFQENGGILWIKGTAGSGKTILCSSIVENIINLHKNNASIAYAYFFFDGRDSQKDLQLHDKLIRSLIMQFMQLCLKSDGIPAILVELYGHGQQQPSTNALEDTLHLILDGLDSAYIIIDSLDECTERDKVLRWIQKIVSRKMGNLRVVVTSRPEPGIDDVLRPLDSNYVDVVKEAANVDIETYIDQELATDPKLNRLDKTAQESIKTVLMKRAEGMFRWVALQLFELKKCSSLRAVKNQLATLPKDLNEAYERILLKIDARDHADTKTFLRWFAFSTRPLTLEEIAETVVVDLESNGGPLCDYERRYVVGQDILEKCSGLITESEGKVKLAHYSIKEYLSSESLRTGAASVFHLTEELSHSLITQTCLVYLLQFDTFNSLNQIECFPLAQYAAAHWIFHAQSGGIEKSEPSSVLTLVLKLLIPESAPFINWVRIWELDRPDVPMHMRLQEQWTDFGAPLYYTSLAGLQQVLQHLLENKVDVNVQGGKYGNALQAASFKGHEGIVKLLLEKDADVNAQGGYYGSALQAASYGGHEMIVKLLLEKEADVNAQGGPYEDALKAASYRGHEVIVKLLLEKKADVNTNRGFYGNALLAASYGGHEVIVNLLLQMGMDVNVQGGFYDNALQAASYGGNEMIVRLLLEKGADVNVQGGEYSSALQAASLESNEMIVKLLLEKGADVNVQGGQYGNALQAASLEGSEMIVKLLLEKDADMNAQGGKYGNALQAASIGGHGIIVNLLLERGMDVNVQGGEYGNALQAAAHRGNEMIVKLLLEKGVDVNAQGGKYGNALQAASLKGHEMIVKLLLDKDANVNAQGGKYGTALQAASYRGHEMTVKLLLEKKADVNVQRGKCGSALQAASYGGHNLIVKLLLAKGADINLPENALVRRYLSMSHKVLD